MANTFTLIASSVLGSTTASITFSSIPSTYDDLIIYGSLLSSGALSNPDGLKIVLNGDTSNLYAYIGSRVNSFGSVNYTISNTTNQWLFGNSVGTAGNGNTYSSTQIYIAGYKSTSFTKAGYINNFAGKYNEESASWVGYGGQQYNSTNAITSIALSASTTNLAAGSSAYLYGIKRT